MTQKIVFNEAILDAFINGPNDFTRFEEHDVSRFQILIKETTLTKNDCELLKKVVKGGNTTDEANEDAATVIPFHYQKFKSRYSTSSCLLDLSSSMKHEIYKEFKSFDIVNRNYSIIHGIAIQNGVELPAIKEFNENYKRICNEYSSYWGSSEEVKKRFADIVYHPNHKQGEREFVGKLVDDLKRVEELFQHPQFSLMQIIEIYSTFIIDCIYKYLVEHEFIKNEHCSFGNNLIYFKPIKPFNKETEKRNIENYVYEQTQLHIQLH